MATSGVASTLDKVFKDASVKKVGRGPGESRRCRAAPALARRCTSCALLPLLPPAPAAAADARLCPPTALQGPPDPRAVRRPAGEARAGARLRCTLERQRRRAAHRRRPAGSGALSSTRGGAAHAFASTPPHHGERAARSRPRPHVTTPAARQRGGAEGPGAAAVQDEHARDRRRQDTAAEGGVSGRGLGGRRRE